ncbi:MAG: hypothetical protein QNJ12_02335 [Ilumatobacter sp.]|uniref:hypothetical protein n=1 Tax=Ilumatobacter sp. TaxID=1967498 RepID=UPI0026344E54|nr:hypothetical protein [Ilumatobacter sp.]MDJ0767595.1 hypothetical protein [Ilumatobacter sp.]
MSTARSHEDIIQDRIAAGVTRNAKRFGYALAAAINGVMLWIAHQLLDWEWPGFLTSDYEELLPILTFSFVVSIVANVVYVWNDQWPVKHLGEMATALIGFVVAVRVWQVYPFDFTEYDVDWSWLVRTVLIIAMVGTAIGFVAQSVKLATGRRSQRETPRPPAPRP